MTNNISSPKKSKIYAQLTKPYIVVLVMLFAPLLGFLDRNFVFFFGLGIAMLILWSSGYNWSLFGFAKRITWKTVVQSLAITFLLILVDTCFSFVVEQYFGEPNLSSLEDIKHNTVGYLVILVVVWVFAAFGEEMLFRGYYLKWLAEFLGNTHKAWISSVIIISVYFGISHCYQGISGVLSITFLALISSIIFYRNRENLGLLILIHGFHDTIGLTFLYLDEPNPLAEWLLQF